MRSKNAEEMQEMMLSKSIGPLITKLAIPTMVSMLITSFYSLADTFFVAQLGVIESSSVGIVFSIMTLIQATGLLFGQGAANTVSPLLGKGKRDEANQVFSTSFFTAFIFLMLFGFVAFIFIEPIVIFLGAREETLKSCISYGSVIVVGAPWLGVCYTMNNIFRSEGKALLGMFGMASGAILNIGFDALFIILFKWGVTGAALATVLSQLISFIILLSFFIFKKSNVRLSIRFFRFKWWIYKSVFSLGLPSLLRNIGSTCCNIVLMNLASLYGPAATAAFSIVGRITHFLQSLAIGFGQGMQPVVGYNWGAGKKDRVKEGYKFSVLTTLIGFIVLAILTGVFSRFIMTLFLGQQSDNGSFDSAVLLSISIGSKALLYQALVLPSMSVIIIMGMLMQCSGHGFIASILALLRQGIIFIPIVLILNKTLGLKGLEISQALSDVLVFILTLVIATPVRKKESF